MKKKITIGLFIDTYFPMIDGVTMVVDNYAKRLTKYANVIVFAPSYANYDDTNLNYKVVRCKSLKVPFLDYNLPIPALDRKFKKKLKEYKLDIVHIHSPATLGMIGIKYAQKHNIPVIGTMHSQYKKDFKRALKSNLLANVLTKKITNIYNKCTEVWTVNKKVAEIFIKEYGYNKTPRIIYNATEMTPLKNSQDINRINNIHPNDKVLLFVGRINKLKNIFFIADTIKILNEKKPNFTYKMLFIGSGQDADELKKYTKDIDNIIMCGKITDRNLLASYYKRADLFLFPSLYDCNSIVQIEAASQKTPGLFIKNSATSSEIIDNINGFLSENTAQDYADKIIQIINDKELLNKVGQNAFETIYKNWNDTIKEVFELYSRIIKER